MNQIRVFDKYNIALFNGFIVIFVAISVLLGWQIDSVFLKSLIPGFISMKANTAIGLIFFGIVVLCVGAPIHRTKLLSYLAQILSILGACIGVVTLAQYIFKVNLGIDEFFFKDLENVTYAIPSGRMAPITAINFILLYIGLMIGPFAKIPKYRFSQTLFFMVALSSFQALIEYLLGMQTAFGTSAFTRIAIHTALSFVLLSTGLLSLNPHRGLMRIFLSRNEAGKLARNLVLALIFVPPFFKFLALAAEHLGLIDDDFAILLRSLFSITFFVVFVLRSAEHLYRSDRLRKRTNLSLERQQIEREKIKSSLLISEAVQASEARLRMIFNKSFDAIVGFDQHSIVTEWNPQAERLFGWLRDEIIGKNMVHFLYPEEQWETRFSNFKYMCTVYDFSKFDKPIEVDTLTQSGRTISVRMGVSHMHISGELLFIAIIQDVTQEKQVQQEMIRSREQALNATRSKSEFLANMSHEIRTPMNGVIGMATVLLDSTLNESQRESAKLIKQSAESLLAIINGILDHSKIEAGKLELDHRDFNFAEVAQDVIRTMKFLADEKGIALKLAFVNVTQSNVVGDANRLRQILVNFLSNALKFTEAGEVVLKITSHIDPEEKIRTRFEVIDSGTGLTEDEMRRLFQLYGQTDQGLKKGGTGLGLYISRELVRLMNGEYGVRSKVGVGSTFWFEVPFARGAGMQKASRRERALTLSGHILLVEDQVINQRVIGSYLAKLGISFDLAANGAVALQMMEHNKYNMILMDCRMPVMDGYEATTHIREKEKISGGRIPIIALSAEVSTGDRQRCIDLGMDEFLGKPLDFQKFSQSLSQWLTERDKSFVIDEAAIEKLSGFSAGGQSLAQALIEEFSKSAPEVIESMHLAVQKNDLKGISDLAHSLKSTSATLGLVRVAELCQIIEALDGIPTNFMTLLSRLEVEILLAETDLSRIKSNPLE